METLSELRLRIKQEPTDDECCGSEFGKKYQYISPESCGSLSSPVDVTSKPEEKNKRKLSEDVDTISEKRRRNLSETSDVETLADDYAQSNSDTNGNITAQPSLDNGSKFQCLLCDDGFDSEDGLLVHLSLVHKHTSQSRRHQSRFARHTCQVCFARFRTLKDFFNHTSCHGSHPNVSSRDRDMSARVTNSLSKNALQRYFLNASSFSRDLLQPTFKCDCCSTVFVNRDAYAMHVMMRVKNDSCKVAFSDSFNEELGLKPNSISEEELKSPVSASTTVSEELKTKSSSPEDLHQAFYIDVTSCADKDEYLQSVLNKSNADNTQHSDKIMLRDGRKCMICQEIFGDQDALAMHVMSRHSNDLSPSPSNGSSNQYKTPSPSPSHILKYFAPFANDRLLTLQTEVLYCEYCGQSFVNRDTLAMHVLTHAHEQSSPPGLTLASSLRMPGANKQLDTTNRSNAWGLNERHMKLLKSQNDEPLNLMTNGRSKSLIEEQNKESGNNNRPNNDLPTDDEHHNSNILSKPENSRSSGSIGMQNYVTEKDPSEKQGKPTLNGTLYSIAPPRRERSASVPNITENFIECSERSASAGCLTETLTASTTIKESEPSGQKSEPEVLDTSLKYVTENPDSMVKDSVLNPKNCFKLRTSRGDSLEDLLGFKEQSDSYHEDKHASCPMTLSSGKEPGKVEQILKGKDVHVCKYCEIVFPSRTLYYLHMGLHNVNTPWQCNMCGKVCANVHDFNAHVIHL